MMQEKGHMLSDTMQQVYVVLFGCYVTKIEIEHSFEQI
jgi:hypothetical protein